MKTRIKWIENALMVAQSGSGHSVVLDGPAELGGENHGVRPMEMVLMGLGGCTAFDVIMILEKGRHLIEDCEIQIEAERADKAPKVFTKIHVHYVVKGQGLTDKAVARAVKLSAEKYCSVSLMLGHTVDITHDFEIQA